MGGVTWCACTGKNVSLLRIIFQIHSDISFVSDFEFEPFLIFQFQQYQQGIFLGSDTRLFYVDRFLSLPLKFVPYYGYSFNNT